MITLRASAAGYIVLALVVISAAGCGESSRDVAIHGRVSYQGEAITHGALTFFPTSGRPVSAPLSREGAYSSRLLPGDYVVTVTIGADLPVGWEEGDPVPEPGIVLPPQYTIRARSTLKKTVTEKQQMPINFLLE